MATLMPPTTPANKHKLGRFCVRVATSIIDNNGLKRMAFKGYGPEKATILDKTIKARDKHKRPDESSTEPLVTTIEICDISMGRHGDRLLRTGIGTVMAGYTTLLIYYAVWFPAIAAQTPLASRLQEGTVGVIENGIVGFFNASKTNVAVLAQSVGHDLGGLDDSWESIQSLRGEIFGSVKGIEALGSAVFQSTTNLSTAYFQETDGTISEYSRVAQDSPDLLGYMVDAEGHRLSNQSTLTPSETFQSRPWYVLAVEKNGTAAFSSSIGIFGTALVTVNEIVRDGSKVRGVVSMGYPISRIPLFIDTPGTIVYLLTGGSLRLISSVPQSSMRFANATDSDNRIVAGSAQKLSEPLQDNLDHKGEIDIDKKRYFYSIRKVVDDYTTTIVALLPRSLYFRKVDESRRITIAIFVVAIILWIIFAAFVGFALHKTRKREHVQLARAVNEENMHKEKQRVMARLSHELRTPMSAMIGLLDVLGSECTSAEQKTNVSLLQKTSFDMMQLLDSMLILAKADAGKSNVEEQVFNLRRELEAAVVTIEPLVAPRGVRVSLQYQPGMVDEFVGDRRKIRQVVNNLLSNAAKFTEKGSIVVRASRGRVVPPFVQFVDVRVEDTGRGIPENRFEEVFEEFVQGDPEMRSKYGGSGLGLSIVRSLCKLMDGDVGIESSSPSGTCIHFWLRLKVSASFRKAETVIMTIDTEEPLKTRHILVAEDTRLLAKLIERMLKKEGAEVTLTADGLEVLAAYRKTPDVFSAILMDLQMPNMDGYDATRAIRDLEASGEVGGRIPIIAVTAHAMDNDADRCREVGMDDYIRKPVDRQVITSVLLRRGRSMNSPRLSRSSPRVSQK